MPTRKSSTLLDIQSAFTAKGWSYRTAATSLGVSASHLFRVMHGHRASASLLARVVSLPTRPANR